MKSKRRLIVVLVLDSCGIGALPDAGDFGDENTNTISHIAEAVGGLKLPWLQKLGLGNIVPIHGVPSIDNPTGCFGKMAEVAVGKDSIYGHWEMMGVILSQPLPTYPNGFPEEVIRQFERIVGRKVLGNKPASGTEIIAELGLEHMQTGSPIVYTSGDSVFQIAAHEDIIPLEEMYRMCEEARKILTGKHAVGRVIARPFIGTPGHFRRTERRRDYALTPPEPTVLDSALNVGYPVVGVGKIKDIFGGQGISRNVHTGNNLDGISRTIKLVGEMEEGIILTNLGDFDTLYGHRSDPQGFARALEESDQHLGELLRVLKEQDILFITADHGCDPTDKSADHSREYVPVLVRGTQLRMNVNLGTRTTFADLGATVADLLGFEKPKHGTSFIEDICE